MIHPPFDAASWATRPRHLERRDIVSGLPDAPAVRREVAAMLAGGARLHEGGPEPFRASPRPGATRAAPPHLRLVSSRGAAIGQEPRALAQATPRPSAMRLWLHARAVWLEAALRP